MTMPENVRTILKAESAGAHTQHMTEAKSNVGNTNNVMRSIVTRMVDEPSPASAAAISKILRLPG